MQILEATQNEEVLTKGFYKPPYFLISDNAIVRPNIPYYDQTLFDKAQELLEKGYKAQCVESAKKLLNITTPVGAITNLKPLKKYAEIGDLGITSPIHLVTVLAVNADTVTVFDCNYDWKESCRIIDKDISQFIGFYKYH